VLLRDYSEEGYIKEFSQMAVRMKELKEKWS